MRDVLVPWFAANPLIWGPIVAIVIFGAIFALACVRVWRRGAKGYELESRLPLEDGDE